MATPETTSERLRRAKEKILVEWEKQVRQSIPLAHSQERLALRNSLPEVLDGIVITLSDPAPERVLFAEEENLAVGHGKHRAQNITYSLEQVINEYHVLRKVLFDVLEEDGQELSRRDRDLIWDVLFIAIKNAASEFKQVRDQEKERASRELAQANKDLNNALGEKSTEAVLKDQLLKTIFERVEDYAIFTLDPAGHITSWAMGAQRIKQFTADDVIGNHFSMLYPKEGRLRDEPMTHLEIANREGRFRGEGLRERKNGELFLADVFITPMREQGYLVGFFKIVADLTERNRIIQERDLSRTRAESLELESELRDRFVFTLSHDLRNPLSAAKMSAQRIARQNCSLDQHRELAQRSIQTLERVDKMIGDLLDASRIKAGQPMPLKIEEYDLAKDVQMACEELATVHGDRFRLNAPASLVGFWDRQGMKRVIENLLTNAIKYGDPNGDVTTDIQEIQDRVFIKVHNEGSPIDQKDLEFLFDLFRRAESAAAGTRQGWGLGLTLVRGITEAHRGIVKVRSLPNEGTSFILDLPKDARIATTPSA
jgi:PAS domain S-box-containing protein